MAVGIVDLSDTNVFLEIILSQEKRDVCEQFIERGRGNLGMSDFTLHSIGVILFRYNLEAAYDAFVEEALLQVEVFRLPHKEYASLTDIRARLRFDFDDAYQLAVAKAFGMRLVTLDAHFRAVHDEAEVLFLAD